MSPEASTPIQTVLAELASERARQIGKGFTVEHDDGHDDGEIVQQAVCLLNGWNVRRIGINGRSSEKTWVDPHRHNRRERLVIAAAMIVAEIERVDREYTVRLGANLQVRP